MAIADFHSSLVALPDKEWIAGFKKFLPGVRKWSVPAPPVRSGDPHATFEQIQRGIPAHAAARVNVIGVSGALTGSGIYQNNFERLKRVADPIQFAFDIRGGGNCSIGEMSQIKLHTGLKTPVEVDFIDPESALAGVHRRRKVIRRVKVCSVVRGEVDSFNRPRSPIRHFVWLEPGKKARQLFERLCMVRILDVWLKPDWI